MNLVDMWIAGQATTVATITSGLAQLINNPQILEKARKELLEVTKGRQLSLKDKPNTPFFNATILEIQRIASLMNVNFFRAYTTDSTAGGYPVAVGTPITAQLSLLSRDERFFDKPKEFNPSRFIDNKKLEQQVVPFGMGKRACIGESLAKAELYLLIGNLILRYDVESCNGPAPTGQINAFGIFRMPVLFNMRFIKRSN